jgi:ADP-heptose:LPS heptosyltransferase
MSPWLEGILRFDFDPYRFSHANDALLAAAAQFLDDLPEMKFDAVIAAECRPTWLSWLAVGRVRPARFVTMHRVFVSRALLRTLRERFALSYQRPERYASSTPAVHEFVRYAALLRAFGIEGDVAPRWEVPETERARAAEQLGLERGTYIAAFPGGAESVPYKRWPVERFASVLRSARDEFGLQPLAVGLRSEAAVLDDLLRACRDAGFEGKVWYDPGDDFGRTQAVLGGAAAFVGNDSGPVHVSQACGVPGVTVFGGGTYPAYLSWGASSIAAVHPLPCFGCGWDCAFERGVCTEAVNANDVVTALRDVLVPGVRAASVSEVSHVGAEALGLVAAASATYRKAQADRGARFEAIQHLRRSRAWLFAKHQALATRAQNEIAMLREHAELRLSELNAAAAEGELVRAHAHERLEALRAAASEVRALALTLADREEALAASNRRLELYAEWIAERDARIALLQHAVNERVAAIEASDAAQRELSDELVHLRGMLQSFDPAGAASGASAAELERVASERLVAIENLDRELRSVRSEAVRRAEILAEMTDMLDRQGREIERLRSRGA